MGFLLLSIEAGTAVVEPWPIAYLVDFLQGNKPPLTTPGSSGLSERVTTILVLTAAILLLAAANSAADSLSEVCLARGGRALGYRIRVAMYSRLQRLPLAYHDKRRTGDVLTRVTGDVLVVEDFVVKSVSNFVGSLMVLGRQLRLPAPGPGRSRWSRSSWCRCWPSCRTASRAASRSRPSPSGPRRATSPRPPRRCSPRSGSCRATAGDVRPAPASPDRPTRACAPLWYRERPGPVQLRHRAVRGACISSVLWLGVWLVDDAITVGTLVLFVLLLQNMFKPSRKIVSEWYKVGKVFASIERIADLLDRDVVVQDAPAPWWRPRSPAG